jgi:2OG-Fe(II) oxygenase superfamily
VQQLAEILANRSWLRRAWPFPHLVARNVFTPQFYKALGAELQDILDRGFSEAPSGERFSRSIPGYDAYGISLQQPSPGPLALFLSPAWRDMMCNLFGISATPYVFAGAHHHAVGSKAGFIHNDFNPVWFPLAVDGEIQTPNHQLCSYRTGTGSLDESRKVEVVRGAALIFFLLNDGWRPGDGGETGLYGSGRANISEPADRCPPENNSLLAFECTPRSFHTYLANRRLPRTSIIMWVHRPMGEAVEKYGIERLERWVT